MPIYFSEHEVVIPGQLLSDNGKRSGEGTYAIGGKVYAAQVGFASIKDNKVVVTPFKAAYKPAPGDRVIGIISDVKPNGFEVDLGGYLTALIRIPDRGEVVSMKLKVGDVIYAKIKESGLSGIMIDRRDRIRRIQSGLLIHIHPAKIPRLIGRRGSMISMVKKLTGCDIIVGKNGLIVINGPSPKSEFAAMKAIEMIESEAHTSGLTERVEKYLRELLEKG
ncbi:MAG: RNA-binding protein [Thaumarchaeota archaeon]|nr:MAG: RNA-binding protein [Nitrososphaerota archaeon]HDD66847.1 S1 RNA-binding domain-containing protein [Nitrososphaeria archaeon]